MYLAQALERLVPAAIHIDVVANDMYDVVGDEALVPAKALLLGACRVIPQEHPQITCRLIDVESHGARDGIAPAAAAALVTELSDSSGDPVVAHRRGRRWLQTVDRVYLDLPPSGRRTRPDGVYLITGGLGRVGMVHAEHLARAGAASIILTGRSSLPEERDWGRVLTERADPSAARVRAVVRLRDLGTDVSYFCADAADRAAMASVVAAAQNVHGPINGVIHAAGEPSAYASVMETDASVTDVQLRGKALGAAVLADLVRQRQIDPRELDFCLLVSSISTILGGAGLAAYTAANCYLDALAAAKTGEDRFRGSASTGTRGVSAPPMPKPASCRRAASSCSPGSWREPPDRWRCAATTLRNGTTCGFASRRTGRDAEDRAPGRRSGGVEASVGATSPPALDTAYEAARGPDEQALVEIWEDLLGVAPIGVFDDFFELGGHSTSAIQLVSRLRQELGRECRVQQIFDAPTIAELTRLVVLRRRTGSDTMPSRSWLPLST